MIIFNAIIKRKKCKGVASIEYTLIATLIAIAAVAGVSALGGTNAQSWSDWVDKVIEALKS